MQDIFSLKHVGQGQNLHAVSDSAVAEVQRLYLPEFVKDEDEEGPAHCWAVVCIDSLVFARSKVGKPNKV